MALFRSRKRSKPDGSTVSNPTATTTFAVILERRLSRRSFVSRSLLAGSSLLLPLNSLATTPVSIGRQGFQELPHGRDADFHVAPGYRQQVLLRWGDALFPDSPPFDPFRQNCNAQLRQAGYNNDYLAFMPWPRGSRNSHTGLLVANNEYTSWRLMFPGDLMQQLSLQDRNDIEIAAHGLSIVMIERSADGWRLRHEHPCNRRITPWTPMRFSGPAAGHSRLRHAGSPDGVRTLGTYANCAGGVTPWGTILTAEENIQHYFCGDIPADTEVASHERYGISGDSDMPFEWGQVYSRWNLDQTPNEPLHVGWIVEVDPYDPLSVPVKRTALGRCRHEACTVWLNSDERIVAYSGDDQAFEYIYRFVSKSRYHPADRPANLRLLDEGVLSVAEFRDDGRLVWHALVQGHGALTADNGFHSQADVVIDMRRAADLVGATPMDRPEDIEVNPVTGTVFVMLTMNPDREEADAANPRAANPYGHILELTAPDGDHAAGEFSWDIFILAGDPAKPSHQAAYHPDISENGWFAAPDNCAFDKDGRLWIATDGAAGLGIADGLWVCNVTGPQRALTRHFLRTPHGSELCGPCFTPDNRTLFVAVQHPGEGTAFASPSTRWPDFHDGWPPRPAVVAVERGDGGSLMDDAME